MKPLNSFNYSTIQPVQMIPLRRCGSHALRLRLNLNSKFYSPYPMHLVDFMPLVPLYGDLNNDRNYFQMVLDLVGLQAHSLVLWDDIVLDPIRIFEHLKGKPRSIFTVAWEILLIAAAQKNAHIVMDKSLDNVHYWRDLVQSYPNMKFIQLVRDPRAQVNSMNKAIIHEFETLLNTQLLLDAHKAADELINAHPEKVVIVRYEDFIYEEEKTTRKICDFLNMEFKPEMLQIQQSDEAKQISKQSALWESNAFSPIPGNVDKYKTTLSELEIQQIETLTEKIMSRYGYIRNFSENKKISQSDWEIARNNNPKKRQLAWDNLKAGNPVDYALRRRRSDYLEMCRQNLLRINS